MERDMANWVLTNLCTCNSDIPEDESIVKFGNAIIGSWYLDIYE